MFYETNDLYLSGYIIANGFPLDSNTTSNGITMFRFKQTDKLQQLVESYFSMHSMVNPQNYGAALKMLKNIMYQKNNNYNNYAKRPM